MLTNASGLAVGKQSNSCHISILSWYHFVILRSLTTNWVCPKYWEFTEVSKRSLRTAWDVNVDYIDKRIRNRLQLQQRSHVKFLQPEVAGRWEVLWLTQFKPGHIYTFYWCVCVGIRPVDNLNCLFVNVHSNICECGRCRFRWEHSCSHLRCHYCQVQCLSVSVLSFGLVFQGKERQLKKEVKKWVAWIINALVSQALCEHEEQEDVETFLSAVEGRDRRQRRTWLLCVSSRQPEIQVSTECTRTLECRVK